MALVSTLVSTVLGTLLALGLVRYRFPGKGFLRYLLYVPVVVPDVVMGFPPPPLRLLPRAFGLSPAFPPHGDPGAHHLPGGLRDPGGALRLLLLDPALEEAARDLGARGFQTFLHVTLPLAWPGVAAGALLALTLSLDDFVVTFFTAGPGATTLPLYIYSSVKLGVSPKVHALSSLIVGLSAFFLALGYALSRRRL